nr:hypothetical protein [Oceanococcus sp. HetDA_MAG_MS8]
MALKSETHIWVGCLLSMALALAACGGGGGDGNNERVPRNTAEAVRKQQQAAADIQGLVEELISEESAASQALDEERYADFDAYWLERYPGWVDRLDAAAEEFATSEEFVRDLALDQQSSTKAVPVPIVLLAAATITTIAAAEKERLARINDGVEGNEREALIEARTRALQQQGLNETQARTRAIADVTQVLVLQGLKNGIEHARQFVVEQVPNFFSGYLPEPVSGALDLAETSGRLEQIRDGATVLLSDTDCATDSQRKLEQFPVCRLVICDPADLKCSGVPPGDWAVGVFDSEFVRDEVATPVSSGGTSTADLSLFTPTEADAANQPDNDNGGGSFNPIVEVDFSLSVTAQGTRFGEQDPPGGVTQARLVSVNVTMLQPEGPFSCFFFEGTPEQTGFAFTLQQTGSSGGTATNVQSLAGGLMRTSDCALMPQFSLVREETLQSDASVDISDLDALFNNVPRESISGGSSFNDASRITFGLSGSAVCDAIGDFDLREDDGEYIAESATCDGSSRLEVIFRR